MSILNCTYTRLTICLVCALVIVFYFLRFYSLSSWNYNSLLSKHSVKAETTLPILRILCFGDSLTAGAKQKEDKDPSQFHSYSKILRELFEKHLAGTRRRLQGKSPVRIQTEGVPGERVHGSMKERLYGLLNNIITYDWVIILGGTNDLGFFMKKPEIAPNTTSILEALLELHDLSHAFLARTIAVSIPPRKCEKTSRCKPYTDARNYINKGLLEYSTVRKGKTLYVDITTELNADEYWSDEVHFTDSGYDKIAKIIFDKLYRNIW